MTKMPLQLSKPEIQNLFDITAGTEAIRQAYIAQAQARVQAPDVTYLGFEQANGDCHVKSGFIEGTEGFVIKIATGFYDNPARGLPSSNGMNILFCSTTGQTLAMLQDEGWLTDIRTGLGGALATLALARSDFSKVLIIGGGLQARHQARCLHFLARDQKIEFTFWARDADQAKQTADDIRSDGLNAQATADLQQACAQSDVIITTTPSKTPLVQSGWVKSGTHITAIGADSPDKQELDSGLVTRADLRVCDLASQSLHHGEFQTARKAGQISENDVVALGDVLVGTHPGRTNDTQLTIADLTGLAVQDAAVSLTIYRAAVAARN